MIWQNYTVKKKHVHRHFPDLMLFLTGSLGLLFWLWKLNIYTHTHTSIYLSIYLYVKISLVTDIIVGQALPLSHKTVYWIFSNSLYSFAAKWAQHISVSPLIFISIIKSSLKKLAIHVMASSINKMTKKSNLCTDTVQSTPNSILPKTFSESLL